MIRVAVADDQPLLRTGLETIIRHSEGLEFVGSAQATDWRQSTSSANGSRRHSHGRPHAAGRRYRSNTTDRLGPARQKSESFDPDHLRQRRVRVCSSAAGASGFLLKDVPPEELVAGIRVVASGDALLAPSITRRLIAEFAGVGLAIGDMRVAKRVGELTSRGTGNTDLGWAGTIQHRNRGRIGCWFGDRKTHISRILTKVGARDRTQLLSWPTKAAW